MSKIKNFFKWFKTSPFIRAFILWVVLLVILALAVDKIALPIFSGQFTSTAEVPNLEGMTEAEADAALSAVGFKAKWLEEGRYNAQVPAGRALVQMPAAGRMAKVGRTVQITRSLGLRQVEIPDLRGKSQKQATITLTRAGLVQGQIIKGAHKSIPRGVVIRTDPMAGDTARVGDTVNVIISAGETLGRVLLPSFVGEVIDDVFVKVEQLGFKVGNVKRIKAENGETPNTVIETSPKEGDYLLPDTKIDIVIAD
ncbi:MAG: PASTA domain-containing protein [Fibrobacter sp.]|nr:PASTA domain-containing protein [Fibrobacter sp.]